MFDFEIDAPLQRILLFGFSRTAKHAINVTFSMTRKWMVPKSAWQEASGVSICRQKILPAISLHADRSNSCQFGTECLHKLADISGTFSKV